ncbi:hypothetical protein ACTMU2_00040 [Cupriavidus basilensis]
MRAGETPLRRLDRVFEQVARAFTASPGAAGVVLAMLFSGSVPASVRAEIRRGWDSHVQALVDAADAGTADAGPDGAADAGDLPARRHWYAGGCAEPIAAFLEPASRTVPRVARGQAGVAPVSPDRWPARRLPGPTAHSRRS